MRPLVNEAFKTLTPYVPGKPIAETERELGIRGAIKLASNENPLGPSPKAQAALAKAIAGVHDYPDGSAFYLKQALAKKLGVSSSRLIVGNGTNEIIEMVIRTCIRPNESLLFVPGSFVIYKLCALAAGVPVVEVPLNKLRFDLHALAKAVDSSTKVVFIANPNNPTGTYVSKGELDEFLAAIPDDILVVLDEAYFEYVVAADYPNGLDYLEQRQRLLVMRTFSKCYGLAGVRVGYGVGQPELIDYLNRGRQPFNVNSLAQIGALAALDDDAHVHASCRLNRQEMARLVPELIRRGLGVTESQANFVLVDFHRDANEVFAALLRLGIIVRPMAGYGFPNSARITIGTAQQNEKLLSALDEVFKCK